MKPMNANRKIVPNLWFDDDAEEAVNQYISIFKDSEILSVTRYGDSGAKVSGRPKGSVLAIAFRLGGQDFLALNGGPVFKFTEAVSLLVNCDTQEEIDYFWEKLSSGGEKSVCGWLKDRFGLSWQIAPAIMGEWAKEADAEKYERMMEALLPMKKLDLATLKSAYEGKK